MLANYNVRQGRVNVLCLLITMLNKEESVLLITMLNKEESPCAVLANYNVKQGRVTMCCAC